MVVYLVFERGEISNKVIVINIEINRYEICLWLVALGLQDSLTLLCHVGHLHHRLHLGHVRHLHRHLLLQGLALPHHGFSLPHHGLDDRVGKDAVGGAVDDWSSVDDRVGQMVGGVVGNSVMGNRVGHCMVGNWMGNSMVGNWMGHCVVGNRVGNGTGDRVSQEANAMVSWRMVDSMSWVGHGMVGSMVHCRSSMMHNRSSVVDHWGSMMHKWCSMVHKWCSMMHNWSSISRSLIIDCLSSVSHFLDHPISTIVVSHRLHSSIGQGDGVRAGGGVAISGLLLLEVCSAVAVVDPVLVGVHRGLGQVLVGQLRSWGSQATADKGQQQDHLHRGTTHRHGLAPM